MLSIVRGSVLTGLFCMCGSALAQGLLTAENERPWTLRLGADLPSDSQLRRSIAKTGLRAGLSYRLPWKSTFGPNAWPSLDVDYFQFNGNGQRAEGFLFTYVERVMLQNVELGGPTSRGPYLGAGLGVAFLFGRTAASANLDEYRANILGLVGYQFTEQFSFEASYRFSGSLGGVRTDSLGLMLGYRL